MIDRTSKSGSGQEREKEEKRRRRGRNTGVKKYGTKAGTVRVKLGNMKKRRERQDKVAEKRPPCQREGRKSGRVGSR